MRGTIKKTALVELTRGCPYKCTYCANVFFNEHFKGTDPETGKKHTYYRERSVERFVEEIIYLRDKHDVEYIYIGDETIMTTSKKRFQDFIDHVRRNCRRCCRQHLRVRQLSRNGFSAF